MARTAQHLLASVATTLITPVATGFTAPVEANKVYFVLGYWRGTGNGASLRFTLTGPAGATVTGWWTGFGTTATVEASRIEITALGVDAGFNSNGATVGGGHFWARVKTGGTPGNVTLQIASAMGGSTATLIAGSWWTVDEITAGEA